MPSWTHAHLRTKVVALMLLSAMGLVIVSPQWLRQGTQRAIISAAAMSGTGPLASHLTTQALAIEAEVDPAVLDKAISVLEAGPAYRMAVALLVTQMRSAATYEEARRHALHTLTIDSTSTPALVVMAATAVDLDEQKRYRLRIRAINPTHPLLGVETCLARRHIDVRSGACTVLLRDQELGGELAQVVALQRELSTLPQIKQRNLDSLRQEAVVVRAELNNALAAASALTDARARAYVEIRSIQSQTKKHPETATRDSIFCSTAIVKVACEMKRAAKAFLAEQEVASARTQTARRIEAARWRLSGIAEEMSYWTSPRPEADREAKVTEELETLRRTLPRRVVEWSLQGPSREEIIQQLASVGSIVKGS